MSTLNEIILKITGRADVRPAIQQAQNELKSARFNPKDLLGSHRELSMLLAGGLYGAAVAVTMKLSKSVAEAFSSSGGAVDFYWAKLRNVFTQEEEIADEATKLAEETTKVGVAGEKIRLTRLNEDLTAAISKMQRLASIQAAWDKEHGAVAVAQLKARHAEEGDVDDIRKIGQAQELSQLEAAEAVKAQTAAIAAQRKERDLLDIRLARESKYASEATGPRKGIAEAEVRRLQEQRDAKTALIDAAQAQLETEQGVADAMKDQLAAQLKTAQQKGYNQAVEEKQKREDDAARALDAADREREAARREIASIRAGQLSQELSERQRKYDEDRKGFRGGDASLARAAATYDAELTKRVGNKGYEERQRIIGQLARGHGRKASDLAGEALAIQWAKDAQAKLMEDAAKEQIKYLHHLQELAGAGNQE